MSRFVARQNHLRRCGRRIRNNGARRRPGRTQLAFERLEARLLLALSAEALGVPVEFLAFEQIGVVPGAEQEEGSYFGGFDAPVVDDDGNVSFKGLVFGPNTGGNTQGIWTTRHTDEGRELNLLVRQGEAAFGSETFGGILNVNAKGSGHVAFRATAESADSSRRGMWAAKDGRILSDPIALAEEPVRDHPSFRITTPPFGTRPFPGDGIPRMNATGKVAFMAHAEGPEGSDHTGLAIWIGDTIQIFFHDQAPGLPTGLREEFAFSNVSAFSDVRLNDSDQIAFYSPVRGVVDLPDSSRGGDVVLAAIWSGDLDSLTPYPIQTTEHENNPVSPTQLPGVVDEFDRLTLVGFNLAGEIAFTGRADGKQALWAGSPQSAQLVARQDDQAPGTSGTFNGGFGSVTLNERGEVAFSSFWEAADGTVTLGIWLGKPGQLQYVDITSLPGFEDQLTTLNGERSIELNNRGQLLFRAAHGTFDTSLWFYDPRLGNEPLLLVKTGDQYNNVAGEPVNVTLLNLPFTAGSGSGLPTSFNDHGILALDLVGGTTLGGTNRDAIVVMDLSILEPQPAEFIVNSTADDDDLDPGDGTCDAGGIIERIGRPDEPRCTLRAAITEANAHGAKDNISFDVPMSDSGYDAATASFRIAPPTVLPVVTDPVVLDAATQPSSGSDHPAIVLSGAELTTLGHGLHISAGDSTIRGFAINDFSSDDGESAAIVLDIAGDNFVERNYIGTDVLGIAKQPNSRGIIVQNSSRNVFEDTIVSGNGGHGIQISGQSAQENLIENTLVGFDVNGNELLNDGDGVHFQNAVANRIEGRGSVGTKIAGNNKNGLVVVGGEGTVIQGGVEVGSFAFRDSEVQIEGSLTVTGASELQSTLEVLGTSSLTLEHDLTLSVDGFILNRGMVHQQGGQVDEQGFLLEGERHTLVDVNSSLTNDFAIQNFGAYMFSGSTGISSALLPFINEDDGEVRKEGLGVASVGVFHGLGGVHIEGGILELSSGQHKDSQIFVADDTILVLKGVQTFDGSWLISGEGTAFIDEDASISTTDGKLTFALSDFQDIGDQEGKLIIDGGEIVTDTGEILIMGVSAKAEWRAGIIRAGDTLTRQGGLTVASGATLRIFGSGVGADAKIFEGVLRNQGHIEQEGSIESHQPTFIFNEESAVYELKDGFIKGQLFNVINQQNAHFNVHTQPGSATTTRVGFEGLSDNHSDYLFVNESSGNLNFLGGQWTLMKNMTYQVEPDSETNSIDEHVRILQDNSLISFRDTTITLDESMPSTLITRVDGFLTMVGGILEIAGGSLSLAAAGPTLGASLPVTAWAFWHGSDNLVQGLLQLVEGESVSNVTTLMLRPVFGDSADWIDVGLGVGAGGGVGVVRRGVLRATGVKIEREVAQRVFNKVSKEALDDAGFVITLATSPAGLDRFSLPPNEDHTSLQVPLGGTDGNLIPTDIEFISPPEHGSVTASGSPSSSPLANIQSTEGEAPPNNLQIIYTRDSGFVGKDSFSYHVQYEDGSTSGELVVEMAALGTQDLGDAPDTFGTALTSDGAWHIIDGPILGTLVDSENDGQPNEPASGDDTLDGGDDEDGVTLPDKLFQFATIEIPVEVKSADDTQRLDAWIDFNGDGVWDNSSQSTERIFGGEIPSGTTAISVPIPGDAWVRTSYARFRLSRGETALAPTGFADSGEVEDYAVVIASGWQNQLNPLDVDRDGTTAPLDALIIINELNDSSRVNPSSRLVSVGNVPPEFLFDTTGDGHISPLDALLIVNFLNDPLRNTEGERAAFNKLLAWNVSPAIRRDEFDARNTDLSSLKQTRESSLDAESRIGSDDTSVRQPLGFVAKLDGRLDSLAANTVRDEYAMALDEILGDEPSTLLDEFFE